MENVEAFFQAWGIYLLPALPISLLIAFLGRGRVRWRVWESLVFFMPFLCWYLCYLLPSVSTKGINQPVFELFFLGFGAPIVIGIRVALAKRKSTWPFSASLIGTLSIIAIIVAMFLPRFMPTD